MAKKPVFPTSLELFELVRTVADEIHGKEALSDADIGRIVGLESARTSRWKHGQLAVNDAARLIALSQSLSIDISILANVAAGYLSCSEAIDILSQDKHFIRFLGEQVMLPRDEQAITLIASDGSEARIVRRSADKYERPFRRSGSARPLSKKEREVVVLLADDDESAIEVFTNITGKGTGITGVVCTSMPDALIAAGVLHPRLVIMDLFLSGGDGLPAIRSLSSNKSTSATEIVATSRIVTSDIVRKALGNGASKVIERPLRARPLGKLLREL